MPNRSRFTMRGFMAFVAGVACLLAAARGSGFALGGFAALLFSVYIVASMLPFRGRAIGALISMGFATLPWLGFGHSSFEVMGIPGLPSPTVDLPQMIYHYLGWIYWLAETPLYVVSGFSDELRQVIWHAGEGLVLVRPFVVFIFWFGVGLTFSLSAALAPRSSI